MNTYKYINPFTDYGFKLIFGTEANKDLLIDFLNAMFDFRYPITDVQLENTEQLPATERERKAIYDIYCTDSAGNRFIVEMQKGKIPSCAWRQKGIGISNWMKYTIWPFLIFGTNLKRQLN